MGSVSSSKTFPGFSRLFSFQGKGAGRDFIVDIEYPRDADPLLVTRGEEKVSKAVAKWAMGGSKPGHVVWTRFVGPVLLSEELVNALRAAGCSSWLTYPVEVVGRRGEQLPTYHGLIVRGRCGPVGTEGNLRVMKEYPAGFFPILRGLSFKE